MVNLSLNQTLMRSLNTSITALLPIGSLLIVGSFILGATTLEEFALALLDRPGLRRLLVDLRGQPAARALLKERESPASKDVRKRIEAREILRGRRGRPGGGGRTRPCSSAAELAAGAGGAAPSAAGDGGGSGRGGGRRAPQHGEPAGGGHGHPAPAPQEDEAALSTADRLRALVRDIPDFPQPGVTFKDITPVLADPTASTTPSTPSSARRRHCDLVAGIEARGFILGAPGARQLESRASCPSASPGSCRTRTVRRDYDLEYGTDRRRGPRRRRPARPAGLHRRRRPGHRRHRGGGRCRWSRPWGGEVVGVSVLIEFGASSTGGPNSSATTSTASCTTPRRVRHGHRHPGPALATGRRASLGRGGPLVAAYRAHHLKASTAAISRAYEMSKQAHPGRSAPR